MEHVWTNEELAKIANGHTLITHAAALEALANGERVYGIDNGGNEILSARPDRMPDHVWVSRDSLWGSIERA